MSPRPETTPSEPASLPSGEGGGGTALLAGGEEAESLAPHAVLEAARRESPPPDALLAHLMDEAMEAMLTSHAPARPPAPTAVKAGPPEPAAREVEDFGAVLTSAEAAALGEEIRSEPPAGFPDRPEFGGHVITAMPTDEELAALFAESEPVGSAGGSARAGSGPLSAPLRAERAWLAVQGLKQELEREEFEQVEGYDSDEIQADVAVEARGSVNLTEPPVRPEGMSGLSSEYLGRPLEPEGVKQSVAWWLSPLVWLNAPLANPKIRDGAGKAALLILLNATAVLVYVFVIRR